MRARTPASTSAHGDLADTSSIRRILDEVRPDEIYNPRSPVARPRQLRDARISRPTSPASGTIRMLEAIHQLQLPRSSTQASTSELYGQVRRNPQTETAPFHPPQPYGAPRPTPMRSPASAASPTGSSPSRNPLQSRVAAAGRDLRDAEDHPGRRRHRGRPAASPQAREPGGPPRLGLRGGASSSNVAHAPGQGAPRLRHRHRQGPSVREFCSLAFDQAGLPSPGGAPASTSGGSDLQGRCW